MSVLIETNKETIAYSIYDSSIITTTLLNFLSKNILKNINKVEALIVLFGFSNYEFKNNKFIFIFSLFL